MVWCADRSKTNKGTSAGVYKVGWNKRVALVLGSNTTIFQAEIYGFKACVMDNKKSATNVRTSIFFLIVKRLWRLLIISRYTQNYSGIAMIPWLKWQKISVQLIWVLGHVRCDGNEIAVQLATQGTLHPLTGPEAALYIYTKFARVVIRDWMGSINSPYVDKGKLKPS